MKNLALPQHINLFRLPEHGTQLHGSLLIKDMQRLTPSLYSDSGEVEVSLSLEIDAEGTRYCHIQLKSKVNLQCQRCMEPFIYEIISDFLYGIASSQEEADRLPEQYEPVIAKEGLLVVQEMVEDELILKLPIVPMHAIEECKVKMPMVDSSWGQEKVDAQGPFQVLKLLKRETK